MKSVMQEASSIAKAIEQAWIKAGQPEEFSIKILEEPQKNFIGFTMRSAKVALFFDTPAPQQKQPLRQQRQPSQSHPKPSPRVAEPTRQQQPQPEIAKQAPVVKKREYKPQWNDSMIEFVKDWLSQTLVIMGLGHVSFKIEPSEFYLRITFNHDLLADQAKEKKLFASFATLIIETLKKTFKMSLRGHKIVLVHATNHANYDTQQR